MSTAIVTGATGILGREIVHELAANGFSKVYAVSRSKKEKYPANVEHSHLDLMSSADDMAKDLAHVKADYCFFAAYLQDSDEQEMCDTNGNMLKNFLEALKITGAAHSLKRVILVCGAKQYGLHLGRPKNPMEESDPRIDGSGRPPNFYYVQQDILKEAAASARWDWTVTFPNDVIGVAKGNFMNLATSLGLYCAITHEMQSSLPFPGSEVFYFLFDCYTSSKFHAKFCRWVATAPKASNEAFNVVNGDACSWQTMWPQLAKYFDMTVPKDMFAKPPPDESTMDLAEVPPIGDFAAEMGLEGSKSLQQSHVKQRIDLVRWSQRQDVKAAWDKLVRSHGLESDAFEKATWGFLGFVLGREYDIVISMNKARKAGFSDSIDTFDALRDTFDELRREKILPA